MSKSLATRTLFYEINETFSGFCPKFKGIRPFFVLNATRIVVYVCGTDMNKERQHRPSNMSARNRKDTVDKKKEIRGSRKGGNIVFMARAGA